MIRAKELNTDKLMTMCAMCYNTLKRSNERMKNDRESLDIINNLMYKEEVKYQADVEVLHLLEVLRDEVQFKEIAQKIQTPLNGLKVASYYGCYLVRPKEIGFDNQENPTILDELMALCGGTSIDFPYKVECCGAYQTVDKPEIIAERTKQILGSAINQGAEVVVVSCPLCAFNLDQRQKQAQKMFPEFKNIPILYFTQLLAIALGCTEDDLGLNLHYIDPRPILKEKGLI